MNTKTNATVAKIQFTPGKYLVMTDSLSRASLNITGPNSTKHDMQVHVDSIQKHIPVSEEKLRQITAVTKEDKELEVVLHPEMTNLIHEVHFGIGKCKR